MNKKAFTLIELLAVIVIIAIIATIGIYAVSSLIVKSRLNSLNSTAFSGRKAIGLYLVENPLETNQLDMELTPGSGSEYESILDLSKDPYGKNFARVWGQVVKNVSGKYTIDIYFELSNGDIWVLRDGEETLVKPDSTVQADILIVAGGGGGGGSHGGGGGGGGVIYLADITLTNGTYSVVVGNGGQSPIENGVGGNGGNSSFGNLGTAIGGGGGGFEDFGANAGGSGGGGGGKTYGAGGSTAGQGNDGGTGSAGHIIQWTYFAGGGGGGAGAAGTSTLNTNNGGNGGIGVSNSITGAPVYYGGGGGGASYNGGSPGAGGNGGGGNGTLYASPFYAGADGTDGTGGGGGGGYGLDHTPYRQSKGGKGIVIIRYPKTSTLNIQGGTTSISGNYTIRTFTSDGSLIIS